MICSGLAASAVVIAHAMQWGMSVVDLGAGSFHQAPFTIVSFTVVSLWLGIRAIKASSCMLAVIFPILTLLLSLSLVLNLAAHCYPALQNPQEIRTYWFATPTDAILSGNT